MGLYDSVLVKCPSCGIENEFQSKSGDCLLITYSLKDCPNDVLIDINRHSPYKCDCGVSYYVDIDKKEPIQT